MATPFERWRSDPEFLALPTAERSNVYSNYFHDKMTDADFYLLPVEEQDRIHGNFMKVEMGVHLAEEIKGRTREVTPAESSSTAVAMGAPGEPLKAPVAVPGTPQASAPIKVKGQGPSAYPEIDERPAGPVVKQAEPTEKIQPFKYIYAGTTESIGSQFDTAKAIEMKSRRYFEANPTMDTAARYLDGAAWDKFSKKYVQYRSTEQLPEDEAVKRAYLESSDERLKNIETQRGIYSIPEELRHPKSLANEFFMALGGSSVGMAATVLNPAIGTATFGSQIFGSKYNEYTKKGVAPERAEEAAFIDVLGELPIEYLGNVTQLKFLTKALGGKVKGLPGRLLGLLKGSASEGGEEYLQSIPQLFADIYAEHPEMSKGEALAKFLDDLPGTLTSPETLKAAGIGAMVGGTMQIPGLLGKDAPTTPKETKRPTGQAAPEGETPKGPRPQPGQTGPGTYTNLNIGHNVRMDGVNNQLVRLFEAVQQKVPGLIVASGFRTTDEQAALYKALKAQNPDAVVAPAGRSRHEAGNALDVAPPKGMEYAEFAEIVKETAAELGIPVEWGGDWKSYDGVHWQVGGPNVPQSDSIVSQQNVDLLAPPMPPQLLAEPDGQQRWDTAVSEAEKLIELHHDELFQGGLPKQDVVKEIAAIEKENAIPAGELVKAMSAQEAAQAAADAAGASSTPKVETKAPQKPEQAAVAPKPVKVKPPKEPKGKTDKVESSGTSLRPRFNEKYVNEVRAQKAFQILAKDRATGFGNVLGVPISVKQSEDLMIEMFQQGRERGEPMLFVDASPNQPEWAIRQAWDRIKPDQTAKVEDFVGEEWADTTIKSRPTAQKKVSEPTPTPSATELSDLVTKASRGKGDGKELLDHIVKTTKNQLHKAVAFRVLSLSKKKVSVDVVSGDEVSYTPKTNSITIGRDVLEGKTDHDLEEAIIHEMIHAATAKYIDANPDSSAVKELDKLRKDLIKHLWDNKDKIKNGEWLALALGNADGPDEVVTLALSDKNAQDVLRAIKWDGQSAWSKFIEIVRKMLGLPKSFETALDEAIRLSDQLLSEVEAGPKKQTKAVRGKSAKVKTDDGPNPVFYELREVTDIIPSHNGNKSFGKNPAYPSDTQERAYHQDKNLQADVLSHASNFDPDYVVNTNPDAVNGPPIITSGGIVLGGNSRAMSMQVVYNSVPARAQEYKQAIKDNAAAFGLKKTDVDKFRFPVLVRVLENSPKTTTEMQRLVRLYNQPPTHGLSSKEEAVSKSRLISDEALGMVTDALNNGMSVGEYLNSTKSKPFVAMLIKDGVISQNDLSKYVNPVTGLLSEDGRTVAERVFRGRALGDYDLLDASSPGTLQKIERAVPALLRLQANSNEWDITELLKQAMAEFIKYQASDQKTVKEYLYVREAQGSFFETETLDDRVISLMSALDELGPAQFKKAMDKYVNIAMQDIANQSGFTFGEVETPASAFDLSFGEGEESKLFKPAFHGSPHRGIEQDKFRLDKIGTGEGAQAYGWGLYFAGKKEVAEHYRKKLSPQYNAFIAEFKKHIPEASDELTRSIMAAVIFDNVRSPIAVKYAYNSIAKERTFIDANKERLWDATEKARNVPSGQLYEVDIPEDSDLLDWDRPLSEQPEKVKKALKEAGLYPEGQKMTWEAWDQMNGSLSSPSNVKKAYQSYLKEKGSDYDLENITKGRDLYYQISRDKAIPGVTRPSDKDASMFLKKIGIPGHRYLDGSSRSSGDGSHNYVIYDEDAIKITKTYYKPKPPKPGAFSEIPPSSLGAADLPELLDFARALLDGKWPTVIKNLRRASGYFDLDKQRIFISALKNKDPNQLVKVLAHEIGHVYDWMDGKQMPKGNILAHIAALGKYLKRYMAYAPGTQGPLTEQEREDLKRLAKEQATITREEWVDEEIVTGMEGVTPDDVLNIFKGLTEGLPEDLHDYIKRMNTAEKKSVVKEAMKGRLDARFNQFLREVRETVRTKKTVTEQGPYWKIYQGLIEKEIRARRLWDRKTLMAELQSFTHKWKPFDAKANKRYTEYRYSPAELYADAFSAMITNPMYLRQEAPLFYEAWRMYADPTVRPEAHAAYAALMDAMHGPRDKRDDKIITAIYRDFDEGEEKQTALAKIKPAGRMDRFVQEVVDRYSPILAKIRAVGEKNIPIEKNPRYSLEKFSHWGPTAEIYMRESYRDVIAPVEKLGVTDKQIGLVMFLRRIIEEPAIAINPRGLSVNRAQQLLDLFYKRKGLEVEKAIKESLAQYWKIRQEIILPVLRESGMFGDNVIKAFESNDTYARFDVIKYLGSRPQFKERYGGFEPVANPFVATANYDIFLLRYAMRNHAIKDTVEFIKENFPDEIQDVEPNAAKKFDAPVEKNRGLLIYMDNGKIKGVYVDHLTALSFTKPNIESMSAFRALQATTQVSRSILTEYNLSFQVYNIPRDYWRLSRNLPRKYEGKRGGQTVIGSYLKGIPASMLRGFGHFTPQVKELMRLGALLSVADFRGQQSLDSSLKRTLNMWHVSSLKWNASIGAPFRKILNIVSAISNGCETLSKVGADNYLRKYFPDMHEEVRASIIRDAGSPDFMKQGRAHMFTNNLLIFSNAMVQGYRGDLKALAKYPLAVGTHLFMLAIAPKILMLAMQYGLFGPDNEEAMRYISDYDKTNYICIPIEVLKGVPLIGKWADKHSISENGKARFIKLPVDEFSRAIGGLVWKSSQAIFEKDYNPFSVLDYATGQAPGPSPVVETTMWLAMFYASGSNVIPYDLFRGRPAVTDKRIIDAGGMRLQKEIASWAWNNVGLGSYYRMGGTSNIKKDRMDEILSLPIAGNVMRRYVSQSDAGIHEENVRAWSKIDKQSALNSLALQGAAQKIMGIDPKDAKMMQDASDKITNGSFFSEEELKAIATSDPQRWSYQLQKAFKQRSGDVYFRDFMSAKSEKHRLVVIERMLKNPNFRNNNIVAGEK